MLDIFTAAIPVFFLAALPIWAVVDIFTRRSMRGHRLLWVLVIFVFNFFGAAFYLLVGRRKYQHP
jgi:hypothetical protein